MKKFIHNSATAICTACALIVFSTNTFANESEPAATTPSEAPVAAEAPTTAQPPSAAKAPVTAAPVPAAPTTSRPGKATQFFRDKKRATLEFPASNPPIAPDAVIVMTSPAGEACDGKVVSIASGRVLAEFPTCENFSEFKVGSTAEVSPFAAEAPPAPVPTESTPTDVAASEPPTTADKLARVRVAIKASYDSASSMRFSSGKLTTSGVPYSGTVDYKMEGAGSIAGELVILELRSWGAIAGFGIDFSRKIKSVDVEFVGTNAIGSFTVNGDPTLTLYTVYASAAYRWDKLYLPFGLNITVPSISGAPTAISSLQPLLGVQVGLGAYLSDNVALELLLRGRGVNADSKTSGFTTYELGRGSISSSEFSVKILF